MTKKLTEKDKLSIIREAGVACFPILYTAMLEIKAHNYIEGGYIVGDERFKIRFERVKNEETDP